MTEPDNNDKPSDQLYQDSDLPPAELASRPATKLRDAAVLIPLLRTEQEGPNSFDKWNILFIRRTTRDNDRHSGQVAFPGGGKEASDTSLIDTAIRETYEETGISAQNITVLGALQDYQTISNFRVRPIVGLVDAPEDYKPSPAEVARIFTIPLAWLSDYENFELRPRTIADQRSTGRQGTVIYYKPYDGEQLWGATARMTLNFLRALKDGTIVLPE